MARAARSVQVESVVTGRIAGHGLRTYAYETRADGFESERPKNNLNYLSAAKAIQH